MPRRREKRGSRSHRRKRLHGSLVVGKGAAQGKMKPALNRIRHTRQGCSPESPVDGLFRFPSSVLRLVLHGLICIAALVVGFRLSREALLVMVSFNNHADGSLVSRTISSFHRGERFSDSELALKFPYVSVPLPEQNLGRKPPASVGGKSSRVHVGRHEILVRPWPHPDPQQTMLAHRLIDHVQQEQRYSYSSVRERRQLLVITPTYVRTFQALHLISLMHTLKLVPDPLMWIVIEAGGASNETAALLSRSHLPFVHLSFWDVMPASWEGRGQVETRMRIDGLRFVRKQRLDGIVIFADDSNTYGLEFFEEIQKVKWIGCLPVGLLLDSGLPLISQMRAEMNQGDAFGTEDRNSGAGGPLSVQGPVCNSTGHLTGWFSPLAENLQNDIQHGPKPSGRLEWAAFVLNARLLWEGAEKPTWIRNWEEWTTDVGEDIQSPLVMVKDEALVEPLGNCGRDVWLWWLRVEARADSKFPSRWVIDPPLEITVPSKRTPWPNLTIDYPPPQIDHSGKIRGKQFGRGSKGKHGSHSVDKRKQAVTHGNTLNQPAIHIPEDRTSRQE